MEQVSCARLVGMGGEGFRGKGAEFSRMSHVERECRLIWNQISSLRWGVDPLGRSQCLLVML